MLWRSFASLTYGRVQNDMVESHLTAVFYLLCETMFPIRATLSSSLSEANGHCSHQKQDYLCPTFVVPLRQVHQLCGISTDNGQTWLVIQSKSKAYWLTHELLFTPTVSDQTGGLFNLPRKFAENLTQRHTINLSVRTRPNSRQTGERSPGCTSLSPTYFVYGEI